MILAVGLSVLLTLVAPGGVAVAGHEESHDLDVSPDRNENPTGDTHKLTARIPVATDVVTNVDFEFEAGSANDTDAGTTFESPDMTCNIPAGKLRCVVTYGPGAAGEDTIRAFIDDGAAGPEPGDLDTTEGRSAVAEPGETPEVDDTDVVRKDFQDPVADTLDCDDASGDDLQTNLAGEAETYDCTVADQFGAPSPGAVVNGENESGINDPDADDTNSIGSPDYTCTTDAAGACSITVAGSDPNSDPAGAQELGTATLCFFVAPSTCGQEQTGDVEADDLADQVEKTWVADSAISIRHKRSPHRFIGRVTSPEASCVSGREVVLERVRPGANKAIGTDVTGAGGKYRIRHQKTRRAKPYHTRVIGTATCKKATSPTLTRR